MRVMIFSDTYRPQVNGVASSVYTLAHSLREQGHPVMVCTISAKGGWHVSREGPFPVVHVPAMPFPFYSDVRLATPYGYALTRLVRRFAPDIIHCHTPFGIGWQGLRAAHICRVPLIGTHHTLFGEYVSAYSRLGHRINNRLAVMARRYVALFYNQCDLISCASQYLADDLASGGMTQPVMIVPNPIDTRRFHPLSCKAEASMDGKVKLIYFGRLAAEKNLPQLIDLVEPALRRFPFAALEIVGDGPIRENLEGLVQQRGLEQQVTFAGYLHGETLVQRIASSHICVSASLTENQPMALLESLACGVPVVALAAAGVPEIIDQGQNGFLVDLADRSGQFSKRLGLLILDRDRRSMMGQAAYHSAQRYSREASLQATLRSYQETIAAAATHRRKPPRFGSRQWRGLARLSLPGKLQEKRLHLLMGSYRSDRN